MLAAIGIYFLIGFIILMVIGMRMFFGEDNTRVKTVDKVLDVISLVCLSLLMSVIWPLVVWEEIRMFIEDRKAKITYITGDGLKSEIEGNKIFVHCCNDEGVWGSGVVVAISNLWPGPEEGYRTWYSDGEFNGIPFELGQHQLVQVEDDLTICNLIGQHLTVQSAPGSIPLQYDALREGFLNVAVEAEKLNAVVVMPRIGAARAGGSWAKIEKIIEETLIKSGIDVYVYTLEGDESWNA